MGVIQFSILQSASSVLLNNATRHEMMCNGMAFVSCDGGTSQEKRAKRKEIGIIEPGPSASVLVLRRDSRDFFESPAELRRGEETPSHLMDWPRLLFHGVAVVSCNPPLCMVDTRWLSRLSLVSLPLSPVRRRSLVP